MITEAQARQMIGLFNDAKISMEFYVVNRIRLVYSMYGNRLYIGDEFFSLESIDICDGYLRFECSDGEVLFGILLDEEEEA